MQIDLKNRWIPPGLLKKLWHVDHILNVLVALPDKIHAKIIFVIILRVIAPYLLLFYPILVGWVFGNLIERNEQLTATFNISIAAFALICFLPRLFTQNFVSSTLLVLGHLSMSLQVFLLIMHWHLFKHQINASTMFILLETNMAETMEFISAYFDTFIQWLIAVLFIPLVPVLWFVIKKTKTSPWKLKPLLKVAIAVVPFITTGQSIRYFELDKNTIFGLATEGLKEYREESEKYNKLGLHKRLGGFNRVTHHPVDEQETYVIVIGEATTRHHMGIYGYNRNTTPMLNRSKDQLLIYNNVISPHTHTIPVLSKVLTRGNYENPNQKYTGTIIQLFNAAGFKTYWLSNQRPVGIYETMVTKLSKAADKFIYINLKRNSVSTPFDGELLPHFDRVLEEPVDKKVVFVHLLGTHSKYRLRYPPEFRQFSDDPELTMFPSPEAYKTINHYDNAVLYNDFVAYEIIKRVKALDHCSYVLYFSDHGEDVFETMDIACHTEKRGSAPMYNIPFILWRSSDHLENRPLHVELNRPYMTDDLIHSIADLSAVDFEWFEPGRSIFSRKFKTRKRIIRGNIEYEEAFANSAEDSLAGDGSRGMLE